MLQYFTWNLQNVLQQQFLQLVEYLLILKEMLV